MESAYHAVSFVIGPKGSSQVTSVKTVIAIVSLFLLLASLKLNVA